MNRFQVIRDGGNVKRYHTALMIGEQTVAHHTFGVIAVILELWPDSSPNLIKAAMYHDVVECLTGDSPAPAKRAFPPLWEALHEAERVLLNQYGLQVYLSPDEARRLKLADWAELCMTAYEQITLGNKHFELVYNRGIEYINKEFGGTADGARTLIFIDKFAEQKRRALSGS
jgi:5'-deoxynucleotidase YfbR-like HD superfamily hydrolase